MQTILPPLSLYIHFPWCVKKCPYCDFNSHETKGFDEKAYIDCLLQDLAQESDWIADRRIQSIFMGGGTPSLFSANSIGNLIEQIGKAFCLSQNIEITLEANPGTLDQKQFQGYRASGINRLSIGIQSFQDPFLKKLGRIHDAKTAHIAVESAKKAGFKQINLDLMHGLTEQNIEAALYDLQTAIDYKCDHISWYQLTLENNTYFGKFPPRLPDEESLEQIEQNGFALLAKHGYERYEISAYAKSKQYCQHNLNYWRFGDYIGIGAGSHSKYTIDKNNIIRRTKKRIPQSYIKAKHGFIANESIITYPEILYEYMLNRLRLLNPVTFKALYDVLPMINKTHLKSTLNSLSETNLIIYDEEQFQTTPLGLRFLDDVIQHFAP